MVVNLDTLSPVGITVFAIISALAYYMLRNVTSNRYVVLAIGVALLLFTSGTLQTVGLGITALGVSNLVEQEVTHVFSSEDPKR